MPLVLKETHPSNQRYTYADYRSWSDGERWELIGGVPHAMSPSPTWWHQDICVNLLFQIAGFLKNKPCKVLVAPLDVRLNADTKDDTVVQPDLFIVCDRSKLDEKGSCRGAPDMVVEVLSPSTARHDSLVKLRLYQNAGVREYWIVDPDNRTVMVNVLENGKYAITWYDEDEAVPIFVLEGFQVNLRELFEQ